jgi:hypothetical protein
MLILASGAHGFDGALLSLQERVFVTSTITLSPSIFASKTTPCSAPGIDSSRTASA